MRNHPIGLGQYFTQSGFIPLIQGDTVRRLREVRHPAFPIDRPVPAFRQRQRGRIVHPAVGFRRGKGMMRIRERTPEKEPFLLSHAFQEINRAVRDPVIVMQFRRNLHPVARGDSTRNLRLAVLVVTPGLPAAVFPKPPSPARVFGFQPVQVVLTHVIRVAAYQVGAFKAEVALRHPPDSSLPPLAAVFPGVIPVRDRSRVFPPHTLQTPGLQVQLPAGLRPVTLRAQRRYHRRDRFRDVAAQRVDPVLARGQPSGC